MCTTFKVDFLSFVTKHCRLFSLQIVMSETKGEARDARLSLRKTNEEVLRKKFQQIAAKNCHEEVVSFGKVSVWQ